uniref:Uncharacterized protein n=1 Tax=Arundo donax TaxID=35708 RepID=A0A0A9GW85_ARUDO
MYCFSLDLHRCLIFHFAEVESDFCLRSFKNFWEFLVVENRGVWPVT